MYFNVAIITNNLSANLVI